MPIREPGFNKWSIAEISNRAQEHDEVKALSSRDIPLLNSGKDSGLHPER